MICKKCGCIMETGAKRCSFCGERAEVSSDDLLTTFAGDGDVEDIRAHMPGLVNLQELADVPGDKERLIGELQRLQAYFARIRGKYATLADLWLMRAQTEEPRLLNYTLGGGLCTLFFYLILTGFFPGATWTFFFVVWLAVTSIGYIQAGKAYERRKAQLDADIRGIENEVRAFYNQAEHCFLPLDYSDPQVIKDLIAGISSGLITTFREVHIKG